MSTHIHTPIQGTNISPQHAIGLQDDDSNEGGAEAADTASDTGDDAHAPLDWYEVDEAPTDEEVPGSPSADEASQSDHADIMPDPAAMMAAVVAAAPADANLPAVDEAAGGEGPAHAGAAGEAPPADVGGAAAAAAVVGGAAGHQWGGPAAPLAAAEPPAAAPKPPKRGTGAWWHWKRHAKIHGARDDDDEDGWSILQVCFWLARFKTEYRVSDTALNVVCQFIHFLILPYGNLFPLRNTVQ